VVLLFSDCLEKPICPTVLTGGIRDMSLMSRIRSSVVPAGPSAQYVPTLLGVLSFAGNFKQLSCG